MANEYLYGTYGRFGKTVAQNAVQAGTIPVYVGTAPVNLVRGYADADVVNHPVKITSKTAAQRAIGDASDWGAFTLCEAVDAHFNNSKGNIGPIYVINVLDPDTHKKGSDTTTQVNFSSGVGEILSSTIILDTIAITGKTEGVDYTVDYDFSSGKALITAIQSVSEPLSGTVSVKYREVDASAVTANDIVGGSTATGLYKGLSALKLVYSADYQVTNLLAAPGWSHLPAVYNALIAASQKINDHWDAFVLADLPLVDSASNAVDTIAKAVAFKDANGFNSERSKVCWPMAQNGAGKVFHISTLAVVETMRTDYEHDSVPMETCGNKSVPVVKQYFGANAVNKGFDQADGRELTQKGITTVVPWAGEWVLWGDHTAAYAYGANVDARAIFDTSLRMLMHITNSFQQEWSPRIDEPMTRALKDQIVSREQEKLDNYVAIGALIGNPTVEFLEEDNSTTDLINGDFVWNILATPTPPLKSATVKVAYTDAGFAVYFNESEG